MKLTRIERTIINHVERYRFALAETIRVEQSSEPIGKVVRDLVQRRKLHEVQLSPQTVCLAVRRRPRPTMQSVARALATQSFCFDSTRRRTLLRKPELARFFPTLFQSGLPGGYYVDATHSQPVLGLIRVDVGLDEIGRIVLRCHQLVRRHQQLPAFRQLIASGQFEIAYLVATEQKAQRLMVAFNSIAKTGARFVAEASPLLLDCLAPLPAT